MEDGGRESWTAAAGGSLATTSRKSPVRRRLVVHASTVWPPGNSFSFAWVHV